MIHLVVLVARPIAFGLAIALVCASSLSASPKYQALNALTFPEAMLFQVATEEAVQTLIDLIGAARAEQVSGNAAAAVKKGEDAVSFAEAKFGHKHPYVGFSLDVLSQVEASFGQVKEAVAASSRAVEVLEAAGQRSPDFALVVGNLGSVLALTGRYTEAEEAFRRSLSILSAAKAPITENTVSITRGLALSAQQLGRTDEALRILSELLDDEALKSAEMQHEVVQLLSDVAGINLARDDIGAAEKAVQTALGVTNKTNTKALLKLSILEARIAIADSRLADAIFTLDQAQNYIESESQNIEDIYQTGEVYYYSGFIEFLKGSFTRSDILFQNAIARYKKANNSSNPSVARALHAIALVRQGLGLLNQANEAISEAIRIREAIGGLDDFGALDARIERVGLLIDLGNPEAALIEARMALALMQKSHPSRILQIGYALSALGYAQMESGQLDEAGKSLTDALIAIAAARGDHSSDLPPGLLRLAEIRHVEGRLEEARNFAQKAVAIRKRDEAISPWGLARGLISLAEIEADLGNSSSATEHLSEAVSSATVSSTTDRQISAEKSHLQVVRDREIFERAIDLRVRLGVREETLDWLFQTAQYPYSTGTSSAFISSVIRTGTKSSRLRSLLIDQQHIANDLNVLKASAKHLNSDPARSLSVADVEVQRLALSDKLSEIEANIHAEYPFESRLIDSTTVKIAEVQGALAEDEAFIMQLTGEKSTNTFYISKYNIKFQQTQLGSAELDVLVRRIRKGLDLQKYDFDTLPPFDVSAAYGLYSYIFKSFEEEIIDKSIIYYVPDGAMQNIPPEILLFNPATLEDFNYKIPDGQSDFNDLSFLVEHVALSITPSPNVFLSQRAYSRFSKKNRGFLGVGNPDFNSEGRKTRSFGPLRYSFSGGQIDLKLLRENISPLPETADEIRSIAGLFDPQSTTILLQRDANEISLKSMDLSRFSVVSFATHAMIVGEFPGLSEPALVLSIPEIPSNVDDGLLTITEIAQLSLNADWVILSACNTAAPAGIPGAEGLSGFARAFGYAGARSLLVSHWWIVSATTPKIISDTVSNSIGPSELRKPIALQKAIMSMMESDEKYLSHPVFWGAFSVVGGI